MKETPAALNPTPLPLKPTLPPPLKPVFRLPLELTLLPQTLPNYHHHFNRPDLYQPLRLNYYHQP